MQTPRSVRTTLPGQERPQAGRSSRPTRQQQAQAARQRRLIVMAGSSSSAADGPASDAVVAQVTGLRAATLEQVGRGIVSALPIPVRTAIQRGPSGQPLVTYVGAEYCPFCAGERWALIVALSRFGTFSNLRLSHSASDDVYPNTPTFSFVGSSYSSNQVEFNSVELQSNVRSSSGYPTLQTPTPAQNALLQTYDAPPYVPASSAGSIPFINFAGQYVVSGASFDIGVLSRLSQDQVAGMLADTNSAPSKAILGAANVLTAAVCSATGDAPADVCGQPSVKSVEAALASSPVTGKTQ
jgi:Domain of unknown function (DUF929)